MSSKDLINMYAYGIYNNYYYLAKNLKKDKKLPRLLSLYKKPINKKSNFLYYKIKPITSKRKTIYSPLTNYLHFVFPTGVLVYPDGRWRNANYYYDGLIKIMRNRNEKK